MKQSIFNGDRITTKEGYIIEVTRYVSAREVYIKFSEPMECELRVFACNIKSKTIRNPYHPSVYGKGFLGVGNYITYNSDNTQTKNGLTWRGILRRCFSVEWHKRQPTYIDCSIYEAWLNFQIFSAWMQVQIIGNISWEIDKDLLFKGNKEYHPDKCVFLPSEINRFLSYRLLDKGECVVGVKYTPKTNKTNPFVASISLNDRKVNLGYFPSEMMAFKAYKNAKEAEAKRLAEKWKDQIDPRAHHALYNWIVDITD